MHCIECVGPFRVAWGSAGSSGANQDGVELIRTGQGGNETSRAKQGKSKGNMSLCGVVQSGTEPRRSRQR